MGDSNLERGQVNKSLCGSYPKKPVNLQLFTANPNSQINPR